MNATTSRRLLAGPRRALLALALLCVSVASYAEVFLSVAIAPPPLPVYAQPFAPGPGYIWTPGYWAYGPGGYFWVPGTWVLAPYAGALWTPGYWGWTNGLYVWNTGYWGPRVGFYGGVNYGYGYTGSGYHGGYWRGNSFYYNQAVNNVNRGGGYNTYHATVNNVTVNRASYNGGTGGIRTQPSPAERTYMRQPHTEVTTGQIQHQQAAANNRTMLASVNQGRPPVAATPQPGAFDHSGAVPARAAPQGGRPPPQQGQPKAYGQPAQAQGRPQGYAQAPPQGSPQGHPQGHPQGGPQGHPQAAPQAYPQGPQGAPQGHPQGGPQGHPQGGPQGHPQGGPKGGGDGGGGDGHKGH